MTKIGTKLLIIVPIIAFILFASEMLVLHFTEMEYTGAEIIREEGVVQIGALISYPYYIILLQMLIANIFLLSMGFTLSLSLYPKIPLGERLLLSFLLGYMEIIIFIIVAASIIFPLLLILGFNINQLFEVIETGAMNKQSLMMVGSIIISGINLIIWKKRKARESFLLNNNV